MRILHEPLANIVAADVAQLCAEQICESAELELKSDLPCKKEIEKDPWHAGRSFGDRARNEIADEIVAFANSLGGVLCLGIIETDDHPKRADKPNPLPRVHDFARQLRLAVYSVIEPPLPLLEAIGIPLESDGRGVVLLRVAPSSQRPHRQTVNKEVFVRRADESVRVSMREITELMMQSASYGARVDATIRERRERFLKKNKDWIGLAQQTNQWGGGVHLLALPTAPIDLGRVAGRPELTTFKIDVVYDSRGGEIKCDWPFIPLPPWHIGLRSVTARLYREAMDRNAFYAIETSGQCEISLHLTFNDHRTGMPFEWLISGLATVLNWLDRIRNAAEINVEYAVAVQLAVVGRPCVLLQYGARQFAEAQGSMLPSGIHKIPVMAVGPRDEFPRHLQRFDEDIWNLAGYDVQGKQGIFTMS